MTRFISDCTATLDLFSIEVFIVIVFVVISDFLNADNVVVQRADLTQQK